MAIYKEGNTWSVRISEKDSNGKFKIIHKRGFKTKTLAKDYEAEYRNVKTGSVRMTFDDFYREIYVPGMKPRLKPGTWYTKESMIEKYILPHFGKKHLNEIEPSDVIKWQTKMLGETNPKTKKPLAKSYLQSINNQLTAIFSYAEKYYKLPSNPAHIAGNVGNEDEISTVYWTIDQYMKFKEEVMNEDDATYYYLFQTLFWCGLRIGEAQALTFADIDLEKKTISVNKTYYRLLGEDIVGSPKTKQSYRLVTIPDFLAEELREYKDMLYKPNKMDRIFNVSKANVSRVLKRNAKKAGITQCRIHDLRHASASLLLQQGWSIPAIAARLGHSPVNVAVTYRYAHVAHTAQEDIAKSLDSLARSKEESDVSEEQR